jgi:hypothetical protein
MVVDWAALGLCDRRGKEGHDVPTMIGVDHHRYIGSLTPRIIPEASNALACAFICEGHRA